MNFKILAMISRARHLAQHIFYSMEAHNLRLIEATTTLEHTLKTVMHSGQEDQQSSDEVLSETDQQSLKDNYLKRQRDRMRQLEKDREQEEVLQEQEEQQQQLEDQELNRKQDEEKHVEELYQAYLKAASVTQEDKRKRLALKSKWKRAKTKLDPVKFAEAQQKDTERKRKRREAPDGRDAARGYKQTGRRTRATARATRARITR